MICLPIYHIAAYSNLMFNMAHGFHTVLISNPRDIPVLVATFAKVKPAFFSGVNTLYDAMLNSPDFRHAGFLQPEALPAGRHRPAPRSPPNAGRR